jgi:hypothetical protein
VWGGPEQENDSIFVAVLLHMALSEGIDDGHETWEVTKVLEEGRYAIHDDDTLSVRHERDDEPNKAAEETSVVRCTD